MDMDRGRGDSGGRNSSSSSSESDSNASPLFDQPGNEWSSGWRNLLASHDSLCPGKSSNGGREAGCIGGERRSCTKAWGSDSNSSGSCSMHPNSDLDDEGKCHAGETGVSSSGESRVDWRSRTEEAREDDGWLKAEFDTRWSPVSGRDWLPSGMVNGGDGGA